MAALLLPVSPKFAADATYQKAPKVRKAAEEQILLIDVEPGDEGPF